MRTSSRWPLRSAHWPATLVANTPVSSSATSITTTPRNGIFCSIAMNACDASGSTTCETPSSQTNMPFSMPSTACSTQIVTTSGSQTSRPAIRYFFTAVARRRAGGASRPSLVGRRRRGRCDRGRRSFGRLGRGVARLGVDARRFAVLCRGRLAGGGCLAALLGRGFAVHGLAGLLAAVSKVGHVPARSLELESGRGHLLDERRRTACRADGERRVGDFAQHVLGVAAGAAPVGVDRHLPDLGKRNPAV